MATLFARHLRIIKQQLDCLVTGLQETGLRSEHRQGKNTRARQQEGVRVLVVCGQSEQPQTNFMVHSHRFSSAGNYVAHWPNLCLPNSCEKTAFAAAASVAPHWGDGWTPHGGPEATHKKRELHETDSSRLHLPSGSCC